MKKRMEHRVAVVMPSYKVTRHGSMTFRVELDFTGRSCWPGPPSSPSLSSDGREDNALIKADAVPLDWGKSPAKLAQ